LIKYFVDLPENIKQALEKVVHLDDLKYCAQSNMGYDNQFEKNTYFTFSGEKFYIITDHGEITDYELNKISDAVIFRDIDSAVLFLKLKKDEKVIEPDEKPESKKNEEEEKNEEKDGKKEEEKIETEDIIIARFTKGFIEIFERFKDRLMKTVKKEEINDYQLEQDIKFCPKCGARFPDRKRKVCPKCQNKTALFWRMMKLYKDFKVQFFIFLSMILASTALAVITPNFTNRMLYDDVLFDSGRVLFGKSLYGQVYYALIFIIGIRVVSMLFGAVQGTVSAYFSPRIAHNIRKNVFAKMQKLSLEFFTSRKTGSLMERMTSDIGSIYGFFIDRIPDTIVNIATLVGVVCIMVTYNSYMFASIALLAAGTFVFMLHWIKKQRLFWHKSNMATHKLSSYVSDVLNGQRVVKAFSKEEEEMNRYEDKNYKQYATSLDLRLRAANTFPKLDLIHGAVFTLTFFLGAVFVLNGGMTYGVLAAFMAYAGMFYGPIDFFTGFMDWWSGCMDAASRVFEVLDAVPSVIESENPVRKEKLSGEIELKNVSFEYDIGSPVIKNVSLKINHGQMLGIVGKTGAGKSTIINLIARLYDATDGAIFIDGVNIKDYSFDTLRKNIGVVSQDTYLFIGSIAKNIGYAVDSATMDEIVKASKTAFAHDFVSRLPDGYDTRIGSGASMLSGGEKQRISIARAIIQSPNILILDEATSAMDTQTERRIQAAIDKLKRGRTVIAIAHRLSTLRDADMLAVIESGELKEFGAHGELIENRGVYFGLHKIQNDALQFIEMGETTAMNEKNEPANAEINSEINYLDKGNSKFTLEKNGFVSLEHNGKTYEKVIINRLLPYSMPESYISVQEKSGEIGIITDLSALDEAQADLIRAKLEKRYFTPSIVGIKNISEKMHFTFIDAKFADVEKELCINEPTKNIFMVGDVVYILDVEGNRYKIEDMEKLDKRNKSKIEGFIA